MKLRCERDVLAEALATPAGAARPELASLPDAIAGHYHAAGLAVAAASIAFFAGLAIAVSIADEPTQPRVGADRGDPRHGDARRRHPRASAPKQRRPVRSRQWRPVGARLRPPRRRRPALLGAAQRRDRARHRRRTPLEGRSGCCSGAFDIDTTTIQPGGTAELSFELSMHAGMDGWHDIAVHVPLHDRRAEQTLELGVTGDFTNT